MYVLQWNDYFNEKKNITVAYSFDIYVDSHVTNLMCLPLICDFHKYFFE